MQVLAKVPGLIECVRAAGCEIELWQSYSTVKEDEGLLGTSDHPQRLKEKDGFGTIAIRRPLMQMKIVEMAKKAGVRILWGHKLETIEQGEDSVTVTFANGAKEAFSFVVGCDGLHSNTRTCLFGEQPASYTGLSQVCHLLREKWRYTEECIFSGEVFLLDQSSWVRRTL